MRRERPKGEKIFLKNGNLLVNCSEGPSCSSRDLPGLECPGWESITGIAPADTVPLPGLLPDLKLAAARV